MSIEEEYTTKDGKQIDRDVVLLGVVFITVFTAAVGYLIGLVVYALAVPPIGRVYSEATGFTFVEWVGLVAFAILSVSIVVIAVDVSKVERRSSLPVRIAAYCVSLIASGGILILLGPNLLYSITVPAFGTGAGYLILERNDIKWHTLNKRYRELNARAVAVEETLPGGNALTERVEQSPPTELNSRRAARIENKKLAKLITQFERISRSAERLQTRAQEIARPLSVVDDALTVARESTKTGTEAEAAATMKQLAEAVALLTVVERQESLLRRVRKICPENQLLLDGIASLNPGGDESEAMGDVLDSAETVILGYEIFLELAYMVEFDATQLERALEIAAESVAHRSTVDEQLIRLVKGVQTVTAFINQAGENHPVVTEESFQAGLVNAIETVDPEPLAPILTRLNKAEGQVWQYKDLFAYEWDEFEQLIADLWAARGYQTAVTKRTGDAGVDVRAFNENERLVIQVKQYRLSTKVGREAIQKTASHLLYGQVDRVVVVTSSTFTGTAEAYAREHPQQVELVDYQRLLTMLTDAGIPQKHGGTVPSAQQNRIKDSHTSRAESTHSTGIGTVETTGGRPNGIIESFRTGFDEGVRDHRKKSVRHSETARRDGSMGVDTSSVQPTEDGAGLTTNDDAKQHPETAGEQSAPETPIPPISTRKEESDNSDETSHSEPLDEDIRDSYEPMETSDCSEDLTRKPIEPLVGHGERLSIHIIGLQHVEAEVCGVPKPGFLLALEVHNRWEHSWRLFQEEAFTLVDAEGYIHHLSAEIRERALPGNWHTLGVNVPPELRVRFVGYIDSPSDTVFRELRYSQQVLHGNSEVHLKAMQDANTRGENPFDLYQSSEEIRCEIPSAEPLELPHELLSARR